MVRLRDLGASLGREARYPPCPSPVRVGAAGLAVASLLLTAAAAPAGAQEVPPAGTQAFELPRPPEDLPAVLSVEVHLAMVAAVARSPLCPPDADCVFGAGGGVGASVERRWPTGIALGLAYDAWFVESDGVYELGVLQMLAARVRYALLPRGILHPFGSVSVGPLVFGDTLSIATVGIAVDLSIGLEIELTETIALQIATPWRIFTTASFETIRDRVSRSEEPGANVGAGLSFGLAITEMP